MSNDDPNRPAFQPGGFFGPTSFVLPSRPVTETDMLRAQVAQYKAFFDSVKDKPFVLATVQAVREAEKQVIIVGPMGRILRGVPSLAPSLREKLRPGATVMVMQDTGAIVGVLDGFPEIGNSAKIKSALPPDRVVVESPTGAMMVIACDVERLGARPGARAVIDSTMSVVVGVIDEPEQARFALAQDTGVSWDDVGGQDDAKKAMREAIEGPFLHADLYRKYGKSPLKGVLLYGPPGNGKTMLGKAAASAIAQVHGVRHPGAFMYVKGPEVLNKFLGESEATIRSLFDAARDHYAKHGYPAVIFVDEADAILSKRGSARGAINSLAEVTVVPQFLAEMDGLDEQCALVILATNLAEVLDPAVVRDGRIGRRVYVPRPDRKTAEAILRKALAGKPVADSGGADLLVEFTLDRVFSNLHVLVEVTVEKDKQRSVHPFTLQHIISGAMLVGIVDKATTHAIERELAHAADKKGRPLVGGSGITRDDVGSAIKLAVKENRGIDHSDAFNAFLAELRDKGTLTTRKIDDPVH